MSSSRSSRSCIASPKTFTMIGALCAIALVGACSPGAMPVSQSPRDPSSPAAPEGTTPVVASAAVPGPSSSEGHAHHAHGSHAHDNHAAGHAHHAEPTAAGAEGDPQGTVYVCPMDPDVTSNAPGLCPKCNMKLVPKK